jgi:hypothetical protein
MRVIPLILLLSAAPPLLRAQAGPYPDLLADWQRNRTTVLAYIDAMPDSAAGFRPTPGVRTFAQQFDHIVTTNLEVAAIALRGLKAAPTVADSAVTSTTRPPCGNTRSPRTTTCSTPSGMRRRRNCAVQSRCTASPRSRPPASRPCRSSTRCGPWDNWCPIFG